MEQSTKVRGAEQRRVLGFGQTRVLLLVRGFAAVLRSAGLPLRCAAAAALAARRHSLYLPAAHVGASQCNGTCLPSATSHTNTASHKPQKYKLQGTTMRTDSCHSAHLNCHHTHTQLALVTASAPTHLSCAMMTAKSGRCPGSWCQQRCMSATQAGRPGKGPGPGRSL